LNWGISNVFDKIYLQTLSNSFGSENIEDFCMAMRFSIEILLIIMVNKEKGNTYNDKKKNLNH
jgi:hypothetical protein